MTSLSSVLQIVLGHVLQHETRLRPFIHRNCPAVQLGQMIAFRNDIDTPAPVKLLFHRISCHQQVVQARKLPQSMYFRPSADFVVPHIQDLKFAEILDILQLADLIV